MKKFRTFKQKEESKKESAPKEKKTRTTLYITLFLAGLMIASVFGVFLWNPEGDSGYSYGKYTFASKDSLWTTKIDKKITTFYFLPQQVEYMNFSESAVSMLKSGQGAIITYNPEENETTKLQVIDIFKLEMINTYLSQYPNKQIGFAVNKKIGNSTIPVVTCSNTSYVVPVINIEFTNETNIKTDNGCIVLSASGEIELLSLLDGLRYRLYGIIE